MLLDDFLDDFWREPECSNFMDDGVFHDFGEIGKGGLIELCSKYEVL